MRFAYADPPYPGQAKRHYGDHADFGGEVDHRELIARLERDYPDGWALSTSVAALGEILPLCPVGEPSKKRAWGGSIKLGTGVRVAAWIRTGIPFPPSRVMWSWEPVILRTPHWRQRNPHDFINDTLYATQPRGFLGNSITGQKPRAFCYWIFDLLGAGPGDELDDLFRCRERRLGCMERSGEARRMNPMAAGPPDGAPEGAESNNQAMSCTDPEGEVKMEKERTDIDALDAIAVELEAAAESLTWMYRYGWASDVRRVAEEIRADMDRWGPDA